MTDRAYITPDYFRQGIAVHLMRRTDSGSYYLAPTGEYVPLDEGTSTDVGPSMRIDDGMARALLDALAAHFGGTSEVQTLRVDYLAERARVDKMLDALLGFVGRAS